MSIDERKNEQSAACTALGEQLSAYLDGELSQAEAQAVEAHLRACDDCAMLCQALSALRTEIAGAQLDPPPELHEKIMVRVRRENRMRRLRRITAAASAGVAAMFCFVVIGGAMQASKRTGTMDEAMNLSPKADMALDLADADGLAAEAVTGGVLDTTIEAPLTFAATGLAHMADEAAAAGTDASGGATAFRSFPNGQDTSAPSTTPAEKHAETMAEEPDLVAEPAATLPCGVVAAVLPEEMRSLSLLGSLGSLTGMSTESLVSNYVTYSVSEPDGVSTLVEVMVLADAQLAEVQMGTLCVVEVPDGYSTCLYVYDITTGDRLDLCEFLGSDDALASLSAETGLALAADTAYCPIAEGCYFPELATVVPWNTDSALTACVARYAMTEEPMCVVEGAAIRR